jgi:DNA-binding NarL/FixJ family response regulator
MRVILVGSVEARRRLRAQTNGWMTIVGEFPTLAAARAANLDVDAIVSAPERGGNDDFALVEPLTSREIQVLELMAEGLPNKGIAARLGISDQTVKFHVASIAGKLGAVNRTDAVRRAVRRGLISL